MRIASNSSTIVTYLDSFLSRTSDCSFHLLGIPCILVVCILFRILVHCGPRHLFNYLLFRTEREPILCLKHFHNTITTPSVVIRLWKLIAPSVSRWIVGVSNCRLIVSIVFTNSLPQRPGLTTKRWPVTEKHFFVFLFEIESRLKGLLLYHCGRSLCFDTGWWPHDLVCVYYAFIKPHGGLQTNGVPTPIHVS